MIRWISDRSLGGWRSWACWPCSSSTCSSSCSPSGPTPRGASTQPRRRVSAATTSGRARPRQRATTARRPCSAIPVTEPIAAVDGKTRLARTLGSCRDGGASLSVTADGGRTWTKRTAPARALGRIQPVATNRGFVVGAKDGGCAAGEYSTDDDAATWRGPRAVEVGWSRVPGGDPDRHHAAASRRPAVRHHHGRRPRPGERHQRGRRLRGRPSRPLRRRWRNVAPSWRRSRARSPSVPARSAARPRSTSRGRRRAAPESRSRGSPRHQPSVSLVYRPLSQELPGVSH